MGVFQWFLDEDRVRHRAARKLSFARVAGLKLPGNCRSGSVMREAAACRNRLLPRYPASEIGYRCRMELLRRRYSCEGYFLQIKLTGGFDYLSAWTRYQANRFFF